MHTRHIKTIEIAALAERRFRELHPFSHYTGTVTLHGMARRCALAPDAAGLAEVKQLLRPYLAGEIPYGNFESYHCGGNGTAWLLWAGYFPEAAEGVQRCAQALMQHLRTPEGIFTFPHDHPAARIWIDVAFAVSPFLVYAGLHFQQPEWVREAFEQTQKMYRLLLDDTCGLLHQSIHFRAPGKRSDDHWSRGNGWGIIALTELAAALPADSPYRAETLAMFRALLAAALRVQDAQGLWHQEMTDPTSYVETSGTGLFLYALGRAVELGLGGSTERQAFVNGLRGYLRYIALDGSVFHTCQGCLCPGAGTQEDYKAHPWVLDDPHAHGPVSLAFGQAHHIGIRELAL